MSDNFMLIFTIICIIPIVIFGAKINYENGKWNDEVYPKLYKEWESQFVCHKCGKIFTPK